MMKGISSRCRCYCFCHLDLAAKVKIWPFGHRHGESQGNFLGIRKKCSCSVCFCCCWRLQKTALRAGQRASFCSCDAAPGQQAATAKHPDLQKIGRENTAELQEIATKVLVYQW